MRTPGFLAKLVQNGERPETRDDLLKEAATRFTGGPARLVNWLSTAALVVPADFNRERTGLFIEKVWDSLDFATTMLDVAELNALQWLPPEKPNNDYVTLGLYLYLADACSRFNPDTTILKAMREARASVAVDDKDIDRIALLARMEAACETAGLVSEQKAVLREWAETGAFTVAGVKHYNDEKANLFGAYTLLARDVSLDNPDVLGMNKSISFALGNKKGVEIYHTDAEAYAYIVALQADPGAVKKRIQVGDNIREWRMRSEAHRIFSTDDRMKEAVLNGIYDHEHWLKMAEAIFDYYPDDMLRLMNREHYHIVYAPDKDISQALPEGQLPGLTREGTRITRESKGGRLDRYRTLFVSHGMELHPSTQIRVFNDDTEKYKNLAQTTLHELFHVAYGSIVMSGKNGEMIAKLEGLAESLSTVVIANAGDASFKQPLATIQVNVDPLRHALDHQSDLFYDNYHKTVPDTSREEVMCNLYGLRFTEPEKLTGLPGPVQKAVADLSAEMDKVVKAALDISREKNPANKAVRSPGS